MPFERFKNSVSLICHSLPHKVNSECSYQNPVLFGLCNKRMNVTLSNTKVCLDGLLTHASPSKRVDGIIRKTDKSEHDYIIPHDAFAYLMPVPVTLITESQKVTNVHSRGGKDSKSV